MSSLTVPGAGVAKKASELDKPSNARQKAELKPGHSLIDWIRYTTTTPNLSGTNGQVVNVSSEQLLEHGTENDCWLAIRGNVYNISPYMNYHPGGIEEIMKGAGKDATDLFNEIHRWVNYDSMLAKCYVGPLQTRKASRSSSKFLMPPPGVSDLTLSNIAPQPYTNNTVLTLSTEMADEQETLVKPHITWHQKGVELILVIFTNTTSMSPYRVIIDVHVGMNLMVHLFLDNGYTFLVHYKLHRPVKEENVEVQVTDEVVMGNPGKVMIILRKDDSNDEMWETLGEECPDHGTLCKTKDTDPYYRSCEVVQIDKVTHDTYLYTLHLPRGSYMQVPIGHHIYLSGHVSGMSIVRPYTVVIPSLTHPSSPITSQLIYLMVKIYDEGALTSHISTLTPGVSISMTNHEGTFDSASRLRQCKTLIMIAAGTGFTPMIRLINATLNNDDENRTVMLLFFNKTEEDIIWKDQIDAASEQYPYFQVVHILSQPTSSWLGEKGRVSRGLLSHLLVSHLPLTAPNNPLVCVCGPVPFTNSTLTSLRELDVADSYIHAFT